MHHPFTSPKADWRPSSRTPGAALAYAYDMVCNGNEIGGGSIRIHRRDVQQRVFECSASPRRRPRTSSASCSTPSPTGRRRTAASRSAGTGCVLLAGSRLDPRRDRLPEDGVRARPAHRRADPDHPQQRREAGVDAKPGAAGLTRPCHSAAPGRTAEGRPGAERARAAPGIPLRPDSVQSDVTGSGRRTSRGGDAGDSRGTPPARRRRRRRRQRRMSPVGSAPWARSAPAFVHHVGRQLLRARPTS